jgi:organic radical activating enzyme
MFGHNKITTRHAFENYPKEVLKVTSLFPTIQGEGPFAGQRAVFVRLSKCNLACSFCDTHFDTGDDLSFETIRTKIQESTAKADTLKLGMSAVAHRMRARGSALVVITGGEPFIQPNLSDFLYSLHAWGYEAQVESNGNFWLDIPPRTHLVISPKINERTGQHIKLSQHALARADTLKFVISATEPGYQDVPDWAIDWLNEGVGMFRTRRVYVSPMNCYLKQPIKLGPDGSLEGRSETDERISFWTPGLLDPVANQRNHEHAANIAMMRNVLLTLQLHLYASMP